jgi:hypothetical protein
LRKIEVNAEFLEKFSKVRERTLCVYAGYDLNGDFAREFNCNEVGLRPIRTREMAQW